VAGGGHKSRSVLDIISRLGFPMEMGPFFRLYLVGRRTTYRWDAFTSDPFAADVGVGQGSALSPVLSVLYLTLVTRLFHASDIGQKVDLMSYVNDGSIVAQSRDVKDNLPLLKEAYGWMLRAFECLGLVLEHGKSEVFHFSHAMSFEGPAIDLGYAPFTGDTPLRPKAVWRYLGFFFDCKLQFKEHARFYTTRAFTTVRSMGMLGNSVRGLTPPQKRLLYCTCIVPVMTYGFRLWFFKGARVKGLVKAMSQVQCTATRWITGNFRTAPGGSGECLGGLLPMHLLLQWQADRGALRIAQLAPSHPLRPILGEALGGCHRAHRLGLVPSGVLSVASLKGPSVDAAVGAGVLSWDEVEPFCPDSFPGSRVADFSHAFTLTHPRPVKTRRWLSTKPLWTSPGLLPAATSRVAWWRQMPLSPLALFFRRLLLPSSFDGDGRRPMLFLQLGGICPRRWNDLPCNLASLRLWPKGVRSWLYSQTHSLQ
jgi:hypothetical protein